MINSNISSDTDVKLPVIKFDDDRIVINGKSFASEPLITELTELFGEPDAVGSHTQFDEVTVHFWSKFGISARAERVRDNDKHFAKNSTRDKRFRCISLYLYPDERSRMAYAALYIGERNYVDYLLESKDAVELPETMASFAGRLQICGFDVQPDTTLEELRTTKSGNALKFIEAPSLNRNNGISFLETNDDIGCVLRCSIRQDIDLEQAKIEPIAFIELCFKPWWQPSEELQKSLFEGERIVDAYYPKLEGGTSFEIMRSNKRLIIKASTVSSCREWDLRSLPEMILEESGNLFGGRNQLRIKANNCEDVIIPSLGYDHSWRETARFIAGLRSAVTRVANPFAFLAPTSNLEQRPATISQNLSGSRSHIDAVVLGDKPIAKVVPKHVIAYLPNILGGLIGIVIIVFSAFYSNQINWIASVAIDLFALAITFPFAIRIVSLYCQHIEIVPRQKFIYSRGVFAKSVEHLPIPRLQRGFEQTWFSRLLGYGTIWVEFDSTKMKFPGIESPGTILHWFDE